MGKRKSSPRLATTSSNDVVNIIMTGYRISYTYKIIFPNLFSYLHWIMVTNVIGLIIKNRTMNGSGDIDESCFRNS